MENGKEEIESKVESADDASKSQVKEDKPATETAVNTESAEKSEEKSEEPPAELLEQIKTQVEYYFGNVNMQRDKFLIEQSKLDDGWIPMTVMLNFKLLASMSSNVDVILKALETSELIEIAEDKKKIRRSPKNPLPIYNEEYRKEQEAKTIYVKGFPLKGTDIEKLKVFFASIEPFENIVMRKYIDKEKKMQFKGSIFLQLKTLEDAKAFMARESIKYGETELIRKWLTDYYTEKAKEREERRQKKSENKAKKAENLKDDNEAGDDEETENTKDAPFPKGSVLHFSDLSDTCTREEIKERLGELEASIAFVDFQKGDKEGWVRLQGVMAAKPIFDKMENGEVLIDGKKVKCRILENTEEDEYLARQKEKMINRQRVVKMREKRDKRGKKGRNAMRGRKRRHSGSDSVSAKKVP